MVTGIICEFNPFHSGHKYLIDCVKNDGAVVCAMSGNFVQRGEFAVYDKFTRGKAAVENGADLVIELPCVCSLLSAEGFAQAGVGLLQSTGIVDRLAFGAECDDAEALRRAAEKVKQCDGQIALELKKGISYAAARRAAVGSSLLDTPNNILAIEYIKATSLSFTAVRRIGGGHDSDDRDYSASAIRASLSDESICTMANCESAVLSKLRTMSAEDFLQIEDVSEGLENRIVRAVRNSSCLKELYDEIKTKRYAHSRIRRIILRSYLGITRDYPRRAPYIRVLAFNGRGRAILSEMKKKASLPVITRYGEAKAAGGEVGRVFELECRCTDLFNLGYSAARPCGTEQKSAVVRLEDI